MTEKRENVTVDDIIGLIKTDEPTNSVILKKEAQLSICEKRLMELEKENEQLKLHQKNTAKEFQTLLNFIRSKGLTLTEYEKFKGDDGMTKKRFIFIHDNVGLNLKTPIMDSNKQMSIGEVLNELNEMLKMKALKSFLSLS